VFALAPLSLYAITSGGVLSSLPSQKGQKLLLMIWGFVLKSVGLAALSVAIITQRPETGSLLNSGIYSSYTNRNPFFMKSKVF
jgi:hypothetical protein